ncbi:MOB kinase activator-like 4, partial [Orchesella cincta]
MTMSEVKVIVRRNRPGTKGAEFCKWPEEPFEEMDSTLARPFQHHCHSNPPETQDEEVWKYEHLRQFCMELNGLALLNNGSFLCAAHKSPKECPAIDYTRHTLDGAACLLNSNKYFPSRVSIRESSLGKLGSVCRRVYRIFSHAYFHHKTLFDDFEASSHLCRRFTSFVMKYNLMSRDNLIVPNMEDGAITTTTTTTTDAAPVATETTTKVTPPTGNTTESEA